MSLSGPVLVAAPDYRQAILWARREKLGRGQWRYVQGPGAFSGFRGGTVVLVNVRQMRVPATWEAELRVMELTGTSVQRADT